MKNKLANFEKNLEYTFKDKNLLIKALTLQAAPKKITKS